MRPGVRPWTDEERAQLADLLHEGRSHEEIAVALGRSLFAVANKARKVSCPIDGNVPGWGRSTYGPKLYWTRERVITGLQSFAHSNPGPLPCGSDEYNQLKVGHSEWPTAQKVLEYFGSMPGGWEAAGVSRRRYHRSWVEWSQDDDDFLLTYAGTRTLKLIARDLNRTWAACKRRLYDLGAGPARDVSGHLSASQVAKEYNTSLHRVTDLIKRGELKATKVRGGHYWRVDPIDAEAIVDKLYAPKKTYKSIPPDVGDYERRYGLRRMVVNGRMERVAVGAAAGGGK